MSRFYDALKEASRTRPQADAKSATWTAAFDLKQAEGNGATAAMTSDVNELLNEAMAAAAVNPPVQAPEPELAGTPELPHAGASVPVFVPQGRIVFDPAARSITNAADSVVAEYYRRLRTKVLQQQATKAFRTLLVVSPSPQEGKTVTVLNLGLSFAALPSFRVLVVDGDLRKGSIGKLLGVENQPGLTNLLDGSARLEDVVLKSDDIPLYFLPRGNSTVPPAELLHSPQLGTQLRRVSEQFDLVLVDSDPVNLVTDTQLLAGSCDAILLVARAFSTTRKSMELAVQDLSQFRIIGTVLNGGPRTQVYRRYKGYY
jgi:capsular exopolysaccharide synthesis family protein